MLSSLWNVVVGGSLHAGSVGALQASGAPSQIRELRRGRSRTMIFSVNVPRAAKRRACFGVSAFADSARPAFATVCARVHHEDTDPARDLSVPMITQVL